MTRPRREFLRSVSLGSAGLLLPRRSPALITPDEARPLVAYGASAGDVRDGRAIVWSRTDRPARMIVEWSTTDSFQDVRRVVGPAALEDTGFTARLDLSGLPSGQRINYRVQFQDLSDLRTVSSPVNGFFKTAPVDGSVSLAWTADTVGQGWGINPDEGGLVAYESMRKAAPDVFVHCGDTVYADQPVEAERRLDDGSVWRNLVTAAKSKVAETLDEFRGVHLYNFLDANLRRFNSEVAQIVLWDDHEVRDNWGPTQVLTDDRYQVKSVALLAARAKRAFFEHHPIRFSPDEGERVYRSIPCGKHLEVFALDMRTYRGPNSPNRQTTAGPDTAILGPPQLAWLKAALRRSSATWKVVASDMPLGLLVPDGPVNFEAVANGNGPALGRELEIADLLRFLRDEKVRNVVWITGDVHYCAAHHYDPARAQFKDFHPFWELVAGPIHAGTFGPAVLDDTFGPEVRFLGIPPGMKPNRPPSEGLQFFGTLRIDGKRGVLTARLHDRKGDTIWSLDLPPEGGSRL
jgi:alkaline phosphatase D